MSTKQKLLIIRDNDQLFNERFEGMVVIFEYNIRVFCVNCIFSECDIYHINDEGKLIDGFPVETLDLYPKAKDL